MLILNSIDMTSLLSAFDQFKAGLTSARSDLEKAGAILYFEFTYELAWKTMKRILAERGKILNSPKTVFRDAALEGLIDDPEVWFSFIKDRNETVHRYNKTVVEAIFADLPKFKLEMEKFIVNLKKLK